MRRAAGLRPLAEALPGADAHRAAEERLRRGWPQLLGPSMAPRTCLLSARRGRLVLGCWDPALLSGLRQSIQAVWPDLQARVLRMTGLRLSSAQVEPCDPPPPAPPVPAPEADPLAAVLRRYRALAKVPFTSPGD